MCTTNKEVKNSKTADKSVSLVQSIMMAIVIGFAVVSFWRGIWYLWDVLVFTRPEDKLFSAVASLVTGIIILGVMRSFYSVLAPPVAGVNIRPHRTDDQ